MGACLDPGYKMQDNFFEREIFIGSIMNFYERVRGKPIEKLRFPTKVLIFFMKNYIYLTLNGNIPFIFLNGLFYVMCICSINKLYGLISILCLKEIFNILLV